MGCEVLGVGMGRVELGVGSWAWVEGGLRVGSWESVVGSGEWVVGSWDCLDSLQNNPIFYTCQRPTSAWPILYFWGLKSGRGVSRIWKLRGTFSGHAT